MPTYIGKVQFSSEGELMSIGSTLYGECASAADASLKVVALSNFDNPTNGVTIHVKFIDGNTAIDNVQLQVGATTATKVNNTFICNAGDVVSFTLEHRSSESSGNFITAWQANTTRAHITSQNNIITTIDGQQVNVATQAYVDQKTSTITGLSGAMHFRGVVSEVPSNGIGYSSGDVVVFEQKEYVYDGSSWLLLGDEGSYALKSSTASVSSSSGWDPGTLPQLGDAITADDITNWDAGTASNATVNQGVLRLVNSTVPSLTHEARSIPNITNLGTLPTLTVTPTTVVVPDNSVTP